MFEAYLIFNCLLLAAVVVQAGEAASEGTLPPFKWLAVWLLFLVAPIVGLLISVLVKRQAGSKNGAGF